MGNSNIKGITIEINGDVTGLDQAMQSINKKAKDAQTELTQVNKLLKFDPSNVVLLEQKQKLLTDAVGATSEKLAGLKEAEKQVVQQFEAGEIPEEKMRALQREIASTEQSSKKYQEQLNKVNQELQENSVSVDKSTDKIEENNKVTKEASKENLELSGRLGDVASTLGIKVPEGCNKAIAGMTANIAACGALITVTASLIKMFVDASVQTAKLADDIVTLSKTTGMSTDALQEWNYASELLDVSTETTSGSITKMIRSMNMAREGTGTAYDAFTKLHVKITDTNGVLRDQNTVFYELIDKLGKVSDETERDALAMAIFGRSARDLNPLIEAGSGELRQLAQEAHNVGYVMDAETLESFNKLQDGLDRLDNKSVELKATLGEALLPVLIGIVDVITSIPSEAVSIILIVTTITVSIITLIKTIKTISDGAKVLSNIFGFTVNPTMLKTIAIIMIVVSVLIVLGVVIATVQGRAKQMEASFRSINNSVNGMVNGGNVPRYASGTMYHPGGLALVGEKGPELIELPRGSKVRTAQETAAISGRDGTVASGGVYIDKVVVNGIEEYNDFMKMVMDTPGKVRARG